MSMHEWRITQTTIEVEMLRLAALLRRPMGDQSRTTAARAGLTPHDANACVATLKTPVSVSPDI